MNKATPGPESLEERRNDPVLRAWDEYKSTGATGARDSLILNFSPLVKYVAGRVAVGLPSNVEQSDLISYGIFGLIDAIEKYEPARGIKFETYAISRIRGAIIDELRAIDWVPRSVRFKAREVEKAYVELENTLKRPPSDEKIAGEVVFGDAHLARDLLVRWRPLQRVLELDVGLLDLACLEADGARHPVDSSQLVDDRSADPADRIGLELDPA